MLLGLIHVIFGNGVPDLHVSVKIRLNLFVVVHCEWLILEIVRGTGSVAVWLRLSYVYVVRAGLVPHLDCTVHTGFVLVNFCFDNWLGRLFIVHGITR